MQSITKLNKLNFGNNQPGETYRRLWGLFKIKRYDACLFFCHLCLEKLLKGLTVKQAKKAAPFIQDLERLSIVSKLELTEQQFRDLRIITGFNVSARYDIIKDSFYKKCSRDYAKKYLDITKDLFLCLKEKYRQK